MSVVNEFRASSIQISQENHLAQMMCEGVVYKFPFTFYCTATGMAVLFDMDKMLMAIVTANVSPLGPVSITGKYVVAVMKFWITRDLPVPAVRFFQDRDIIVDKIRSEFLEKHAAHLLDSIINA